MLVPVVRRAAREGLVCGSLATTFSQLGGRLIISKALCETVGAGIIAAVAAAIVCCCFLWPKTIRRIVGN